MAGRRPDFERTRWRGPSRPFKTRRRFTKAVFGPAFSESVDDQGQGHQGQGSSAQEGQREGEPVGCGGPSAEGERGGDELQSHGGRDAGEGLWKTGGKTPAATLYSAILGEITTKGSEARFKKTDRGQFTLK